MHLNDEPRRLEALERYTLLAAQPERTLDHITQAAADICGVPYAFVTLIGSSQRWFRSSIGLSITDQSLEYSFCSYALEQPQDMMIVADTSNDNRFIDFPLVKGDPYIRFYAGKPLVSSEGFAIGTLFVLDSEPRNLSESQKNAFVSLANAIPPLLALQKKLHEPTVNGLVSSPAEHISDNDLIGSDLNKGNSEQLKFMESAPDAMLVYSEEGQIKMANSHCKKLFGYSPEELYEMHTDALVVDPDLEAYQTARQQFASLTYTAASQALELEMTARTKSGNELPVDVTIYPLLMDGVFLRSASYRDATSRLETERALTASKELAENATKTKSRFLAAASHDLRQPLQSIKMYLSVLERLDEMPKNAQETCRDASKSLDVMSRLLDALLDISELDSGSIIAEKQDVMIGAILDNVISTSQPHADQKNLQLSCQFSNEVVHTDPALLERILENYVSNAIRHTKQGSVDVRCDVKGANLVIAVADSGVGIPEDELETVFEEYYQLDNPARDRKRGLGLGLSIVKLIANLLDCPLKVSSILGSGSVFSVAVPLGNSKAAEKLKEKNEQEHENCKQVVLLVDDDTGVVKSTARLLKLFDLDVHTALSGDEALTKISNGLNPDFLVSDFRLPSYNGLELIRRVRESLGRELPAIIVSGDISAQEIKQADLIKFTALSKPVDPEQLISLIESRLLDY